MLSFINKEERNFHSKNLSRTWFFSSNKFTIYFDFAEIIIFLKKIVQINLSLNKNICV